MSAEERTEKATPKKRDEARKKGQVARSTDLNGSVVLLAGLVALSAFGGRIVQLLAGAMHDSFVMAAHPTVAGKDDVRDMILTVLVGAAGPIALTCMVAGVVVSIGQVGFKPSGQALKPDPRRLDPLKGAKNLFGPKGLMEGLKALMKVVVVSAVAALAILPRLQTMGSMTGIDPASLGAVMGANARQIIMRVALVYLLLGLADWALQRRRLEKQLRMSKEELKEEMKQQSVPQLVKSAQRRRQMQQARARMMSDVPTADVIVTNPTHYSVALRYDGTSPAPKVVAKGKDLVAFEIRRIAAEHGVPIVPDPPLARELHRTVEIGQQIPEALFQAVAQVLAFVYRTAGRRRMA